MEELAGAVAEESKVACAPPSALLDLLKPGDVDAAGRVSLPVA